MWVADRVEKDLTKEESTIDEETLVFSKFRQAIGEESSSEQESSTAGTEIDLPGSQEFGSTPIPPVRSAYSPSSPPELETTPTPEPTIDAIFGSAEQIPETAQQKSGGSASGTEQERSFVLLLEQFLESVQSGNDDRTKLLSDLIRMNAIKYLQPALCIGRLQTILQITYRISSLYFK